MALAEEEAAGLDARYEHLDERNHKRINAEAVKRLSVVAHLRQSDGALRARRRPVIHELIAGL